MSNTKKILFWPDVYKEQGHWLPTLAWADYIRRRWDDWYAIEYMGISDCEEIVKSFRWEDVSLVSNGKKKHFRYNTIFSRTYYEGYTNKVQTTPSSRWKPDHIWVMACAGFENSQLEQFPFSLKIIRDADELRSVILSRKPDMLVSGYFTSLESLILYYHSYNSSSVLFNELKKFVISTTYLRHPDDDPATHAIQNLMAFSPEEQNMLINIVKNHQSDPDLWFEDCNCTLEEFVNPLRTFNEFIPCPSKFDYKNYEKYHGTLVQYGEPCITKEFEKARSTGPKVDWDEVYAKSNLIYVTAGSQVLDYEESAMTLFRSMIDAMASAEMKNYHLILCVGSTLIQKNWVCPDNVTVCGWAPQREILDAMRKKNLLNADGQKSCCAIIHGGLATIKECVYYEVPFLILPLGKDQMDNALRLEDCGINNRFHIEYIKPKCLIYFINQILHDYTLLNNLQKLSSIFREEEKNHPIAKRLVELLEAIPDSSNS